MKIYLFAVIIFLFYNSNEAKEENEFSMESRQKDAIFKFLCNILPLDKSVKCLNMLHSKKKYLEKSISIDEKIDIQIKTDPIPCKFCKKILNQLMQSDKTKDQLEKDMKTICNILPDYARLTCQQIIYNYKEIIINMILNKETAEKICQTIRLCNPIVEKQMDLKQNFLELVETVVYLNSIKDLEECMLCKEVVFIVSRLTSSSKTEENLNNALDKSCLYLPISKENLCNDFVKINRKIIVQYFLTNIPWASICQKLKLCYVEEFNKHISNQADIKQKVEETTENSIYSMNKNEESKLNKMELIRLSFNLQKSQNLEKFIENKENSENPFECFLCKEIMKELKRLLKNKHTKADIEKALRNVCHFLPGRMRKRCQNFIKRFANDITNFIINKIPIDRICQKLQVCAIKNDNFNYLFNNIL